MVPQADVPVDRLEEGEHEQRVQAAELMRIRFAEEPAEPEIALQIDFVHAAAHGGPRQEIGLVGYGQRAGGVGSGR